MPARSRTSQVHAATNIPPKLKSSEFGKSTQSSLATQSKSIYNTKPTTGKRKRNEAELLKEDTNNYISARVKKEARTRKDGIERRLKPFRGKAPKSFLEKLARAQSQRMIVIGRKRAGSGIHLREEIDVVGSTGNIYKVTIGILAECTCPDHVKGHECKHKVYVLHTVLKAPAHLQYQRAFLTDELDEIFSGAPPIPTDVGHDEDNNGKRRPIEGECPICYMDFEEDKNELVWCKAACGNNMHKSCFEQWAASQKGQVVRCVYCRAEWKLDKKDLDSIKKAGTVSEEGYVNVAAQFGMSGARDYSSYYQPWARRQFGYGW